ncbi:MAG TPA: chromate efflux transporter [Solirubrobacteraceae bacterium]
MSADPRPAGHTTSAAAAPSLGEIVREWGRIGCLGFGGPPTHMAMLRRLCVERRGWLEPEEFEDALAACNLLPGPASTQLSIFCAWRLAGRRGALLGGAAFIAPGLVAVLALASVFLSSSPPRWVLGAGAGAGATVAAIALHAGLGLAPASVARTSGVRRARWLLYALLGALAAAALGAGLVIVLLACGLFELALRTGAPQRFAAIAGPLPLASAGGLGALAWTALKVGALSYGGGFVIVPLMRADAVHVYHWMSEAQFLDAVALGQVTPGPVTHTVAAVGYAAAGVGGGLLAALIAFAPSFAFVLLGARRFGALRGDRRARAFLDGAAPAAIGAILGSAVPLALSLQQPWQFAVLAGAGGALLLGRSILATILAAGAIGVLLALAGAPLPS